MKIAILGAGQIGRAAFQIIEDLRSTPSSAFSNITAFIIDSNKRTLKKALPGDHFVYDLETCSSVDLSQFLSDQSVTHVINALPFFLNEKVAISAKAAHCSYIDFTEDDIMADKVQSIYKDSGLNCAVKCGLAPGVINYIGHSLAKKIDHTESLMISVGALPRTVSYLSDDPSESYNLTWSVDGLVNEYLRPCRVRVDDKDMEIPPLGKISKVIIDGAEYEAAHTSGGVGSLVYELFDIPNVAYMTLRYPGHYAYAKEAIQRHNGNFHSIKEEFLKKFPFTDDDVIIVYATAIGTENDGTFIRRSYSDKFYGVKGLTGIQSTTAGSGVAVLELMLNNKINGTINHADVPFEDFKNTLAFKTYYRNTSTR